MSKSLHSGQQTHYGPTPPCVPVVSPVTAPPPILAIATPRPHHLRLWANPSHSEKSVHLKELIKLTAGVLLKTRGKWMDHSKGFQLECLSFDCFESGQLVITGGRVSKHQSWLSVEGWNDFLRRFSTSDAHSKNGEASGRWLTCTVFSGAEQTEPACFARLGLPPRSVCTVVRDRSERLVAAAGVRCQSGHVCFSVGACGHAAAAAAAAAVGCLLFSPPSSQDNRPGVLRTQTGASNYAVCYSCDVSSYMQPNWREEHLLCHSLFSVRKNKLAK